MPRATDGRPDQARLDEQRERAQGSFVIRLTMAPIDDAGWRGLRRALRFSRADESWLRARVPGVVRHGARTDLLPVVQRLRDAGYAAVLERRDRGETSE